MGPINEQVWCYRRRIKKLIVVNKVIKIFQRCGILFRDSLGLDEPYLTKKNVLSLKVINISLMGSSKGKDVEIDTVS